MRVAFITSSATAGLTDDDRLALPPLSALGIEVEPAVWGRGAESFRGFDLAPRRAPPGGWCSVRLGLYLRFK